MSNYKKILVFALIIFLQNQIISQEFAPQVGLQNSTAIHKDSSVFVSWANSCVVTRGYINISDTSIIFQGSNKATFGADSMAIGKPEGNMDIISLGDGGTAILSFNPPICDKNGFDFAVFENGFIVPNDTKMAFLELAFVEISSNGQDFYRFPSISATSNDFQISTFDNLDATNVHNLAGKYTTDYGTPFDLEEMQEFSPELDLNHITHIKIIDVIGSINEDFASYDSYGNIINDPFPTPFNSGGFDLNAVGVIHQTTTLESNKNISIYPNPATDFIRISSQKTITKIIISNIQGQQINIIKINDNSSQINISNLEKGIYLISFFLEDSVISQKFAIY